MPGVVIAGTHSGCGKTTVTLGLLAALKKRGLEVQSFKAGPDFIDSGLHRMITGRPSRNLDLWMCGEGYVRDCYRRHSADADIAVVEGVMGLYDGAPSTAALASTLGLRVILVIDAYGMAETAGPIVRGFTSYSAEALKTGKSEAENTYAAPQIGGVILNRIASENHFRRIKESILDVPVLGYLPREHGFEIPHRHLGLTVAEESPIAEENIDRLADTVSKYVDVEAVIRQGTKGERKGEIDERPITHHPSPIAPVSHHPSPVASIAVARDRAFSFYYEDNLDLLRDAGARIVTFSPLSDPGIPEGVDAVYIGGGYPELHAEALSGNMSMLGAIRKWAGSGKPLYAECGGLMYLSRGILDFDGNFFSMAGVFPFETIMKRGRSKLGYREVTLKTDCLLGNRGGVLRGHEFHYSEIQESAETQYAQHVYSARNGAGEELHPEGYRMCNALASYIHIHFGSNPEAATHIVRHMRRS